MVTNTSKAANMPAAEGLPKFDGADLSRLTLSELRALHSRVVVMQERAVDFELIAAEGQAPAWDVAQEITRFFDGCENAILAESNSRPANDEDDAVIKAFVDLSAQARMGNTLDDLLDIQKALNAAVGEGMALRRQENGPAEAAASPSRGSSQLSDKGANVGTNTSEPTGKPDRQEIDCLGLAVQLHDIVTLAMDLLMEGIRCKDGANRTADSDYTIKTHDADAILSMLRFARNSAGAELAIAMEGGR